MLTSTMIEMAALAASTFISEDLTCLTAGLLVSRGDLGAAPAVLGCFLGIFAGDLGLWLAGRLLGRRALTLPFVAGRVPSDRLDSAGVCLDRNLPGAIMASRFLPGTRLPLYLAAGILGRRPWRFALWSFLAVLIWTPLLVLASAAFGPAFVEVFEMFAGGGWVAVAAAALTLGLAGKILSRLAAPAATAIANPGPARFHGSDISIARARLVATVSRLWRWEFWPAWLFYPPVALWIGLLSLRYRGFGTVTAANPAMPDGGFVGESKQQILNGLPARWVLPSGLIPPADTADRMGELERLMSASGWSYPVILKPDAGERGAGVKLIRDAGEARGYLSEHAAPVLAQRYHPGPREAGIFYYRMPGEARGRIFSITEKIFPEVVGDGETTLEQLIWRHPRHRMQARTFLARHRGRLHEVPSREERVRLCLSGNHVQGTMFRDGSHLLTPQLESAIDGIARNIDGFHFGRFDIRYADNGRLKAGQDFFVVELNGVTSESTNIYDPSRSLLSAWLILCRQWTLLFRIGHLNRARGHRATPTGELMVRVIGHYRRRPAWVAAD